MIRQVTAALKQHYIDNKYCGGFMSRVAYGPDTHQYATQILEEQIPSPAPSLNGSITVRRRYCSKVPVLKPANWRVFHELHEVHRIMRQLKNQHLYKKTILSVLQKITTPYHNHNQTPLLVSEFISNPSIAKAIQRTPTIPIYPRNEHFNPLQIVIGTLVARKMIRPESNAFYESHINRAKLTKNKFVEDAQMDQIIPFMRRKEYERHYKLDPDHWYKYWPKNRHNTTHQSVQRFIYTISENEHWFLPTEFYQKQSTNTWTLAPPPNTTALVDNELIEREKIAGAIYHELFQLTH
jgi:hypothetical protein